jgi:uncharacterized membrane protein
VPLTLEARPWTRRLGGADRILAIASTVAAGKFSWVQVEYSSRLIELVGLNHILAESSCKTAVFSEVGTQFLKRTHRLIMIQFWNSTPSYDTKIDFLIA